MHGSYLHDWLSRPEDHDWRLDAALGGGSRAFGDIGVHWCDVAEFTTGHRITRLVARMTTVPRGDGRPPPDTEDAATVLFETDRGAIGAVVVSQVSPGVPAGHPQVYLCFTGFVADVYAAAAGDPPDGLPTFDDGLRAAVITDAVLASAAGGGWVEVPAQTS